MIDLLNGFDPIEGRICLIAMLSQVVGEQLTYIGIIIDDENPVHVDGV